MKGPALGQNTIVVVVVVVVNKISLIKDTLVNLFLSSDELDTS